MVKPFVNDRGFIKCPCRRCLNNASHQLEDLESHIFRNGFMFGYNQWIHHGEPATANAGTTEVGPSGGIHERDKMIDVLDDIISEDADEDAVGGPSSNEQYDDLFAALRSELYPGVSSFSSLNFLVKLMHLKYPSSQGTKSFSASRYDMRNRETEEWPMLVSSWKTFRTNKKGEWARLEEELQTQTQEATSSGTEVDEHAVTRRVLGEQRGHERGVSRILKGLGGSPSSTTRSRTSCGARSSSSGPSQEEFAAMQAQFAAMQAQSDQYRSFAAMQQQFLTNLLGQLHTTVPNFHLDSPFPVFPNLNEPLNPTPNPYPAGNDNQQEEAEDDENLGED
ncbi:hypothetical protein UlMin_033164 [Ulmus minor]